MFSWNAGLKMFAPRNSCSTVRLLVAQILAGVLALGCVAVASSGSAAATNFDGHWSVVIITNRGDCDPTFRYGVQIINGTISTDAEATVRGRVSATGAVRVILQSGKQWAAGSGHLRGDSGGGVWHGKGTRGVAHYRRLGRRAGTALHCS